MRPTVHDIAAAAGVSLATVDRVLNNRPGVRPATRTHVEAVIETIGFVRDIAAANLAKGRTYPLVFVTPSGSNSFMAGLRSEILAAKARSGLERTAISLIDVPPFDGAALAAALNGLIDHPDAVPPGGVGLVAVDHPAVLAAIARLKEAGIAVVTLVSDLAGSGRDHFAGIDNIAAGRTAASLMAKFLKGTSGPVAVLAGSMRVGDHRDRLEGFRQSIITLHPGLTLLDAMEGHDNPDEAEALISHCLKVHPDLAGIYSLGAGNRGLIRALAGLEKSNGRPAVIVHELTEFTRDGLKSDLVDVVLNQDAGHEVRSAIRVLKARIDGQPMLDAQERIRIDIFVKDNLP